MKKNLYTNLGVSMIILGIIFLLGGIVATITILGCISDSGVCNPRLLFLILFVGPIFSASALHFFLTLGDFLKSYAKSLPNEKEQSRFTITFK